MAKKHSLVRTIYLYLFTIIGLSLVVIGTVRFLDMGLKAFVFTGADEPERIQQRYYQGYLPSAVEKIATPEDVDGVEGLTDDEKESLKNFIKNYEEWREEGAKIDYVSSRRQRDASINLSLLLVGLPLYLYHWRIIRRETKGDE
ncbi:MAG: hypothetical protein WC919_07055 [Candidatus Paceibacterota bacterium]|jgi:hypothetical protein|nr:hypothetical protein [Candidatus Paceibacterota bacterium]